MRAANLFASGGAVRTAHRQAGLRRDSAGSVIAAILEREPALPEVGRRRSDRS